MLVSMVDAAEGLCPHVMKRSSLRQELLKAAAGRMTVPRSFITTTLLEQSGVDIINKIRSDMLMVSGLASVIKGPAPGPGPVFIQVTAADL